MIDLDVSVTLEGECESNQNFLYFYVSHVTRAKPLLDLTFKWLA